MQFKNADQSKILSMILYASNLTQGFESSFQAPRDSDSVEYPDFRRNFDGRLVHRIPCRSVTL